MDDPTVRIELNFYKINFKQIIKKMAPAISKFDMENGRKKRGMYAAKPAIPLERAKRTKYDPSELVKFELYRNPEDTSSAKYTISIPKFSGGTPEEILNFFDQF